MLKTIFYCIFHADRENRMNFIFLYAKLKEKFYVAADDVMTCFLFHMMYIWCFSVQEMSNKWQILATVFIPISFTLSHESEKNISFNLLFLASLELKIHTFAELLARRDFFYRCWKTKAAFLCSFDKHTTFDSRLNIRLVTCVLAIILLFLVILPFFQRSSWAYIKHINISGPLLVLANYV